MLTDEQVRQFREDGYLVFAALIQGERLAYYKQVFDELVAAGCKLTDQVPHWTLELDERGEPQAGLLHKIQGRLRWSMAACWSWRVNRRF